MTIDVKNATAGYGEEPGGGAAGNVTIVDGAVAADVLDLTNYNALATALVDANGDQITSFGGGAQYVDGDTDATIVGTAIMWKDTSDTVRVPSATKPMPVQVYLSTIRQGHAASADFAINLTTGPLASDTNLLAGRSSATIDNTSNLYEDYIVGGFVTTGTSPTSARAIELWAWGIMNDTPIYPDTISGSDANISLTSTAIKYAGLRLIDTIVTDSTSNRKYSFAPTSLRSAFKGILPKKFGIFIVHSTGVALNSTGSNHVLSYTGVYRSYV